jgi:hypothetical protein
MPTRKFSNWSDKIMPIGSTGVLGGKNQSNNIVILLRLLVETVAQSWSVSGNHQGKADSATPNFIFRLARKSHIIHN